MRLVQQRLHAIPILNVRGVDGHGQHLALRIDNHLPLAPVEVFAAVEAAFAACFGDDAIVNTDEWSAEWHLATTGRIHQTVCHTPGQRDWARDDDGDGIREVHNNTMEGIWTGCRNVVRFFRGGPCAKWPSFS
jgi:hypothetical protein